MMKKLLALSLLGSVSLAWMPLALAATTTVSDLESQLQSMSCVGKEGKAVGQCIGDVLKVIKQIQYNYSLLYRQEVADWHTAHDAEGLTAAHIKALGAFNQQMQQQRKDFDTAVNTAQKTFFDQQASVRTETGSVDTRDTTVLDTATEATYVQKCSVQKDDRAVRTCLRNLIQRASAAQQKMHGN